MPTKYLMHTCRKTREVHTAALATYMDEGA